MFDRRLNFIRFFFYKNTGYFDIKQSLSIKRRQDRSEALQLPDETDPSTLLALGQREFKSGNTDIAILFISKARHLQFYRPIRFNLLYEKISLIPITFNLSVSGA